MGVKQEVGSLPKAAVALIILGVIVLAGTAVLLQFEEILKDSTSVLNESVAYAAGTGQLANDDVTGIAGIRNATEDISLADFTIGSTFNFTSAGDFQLDGGIAGDETYFLDYAYEADSTASASAVAFAVGLGIFGLFSAIMALAILGKAVIKSFK